MTGFQKHQPCLSRHRGDAGIGGKGLIIDWLANASCAKSDKISELDQIMNRIELMNIALHISFQIVGIKIAGGQVVGIDTWIKTPKNGGF